MLRGSPWSPVRSKASLVCTTSECWCDDMILTSLGNPRTHRPIGSGEGFAVPNISYIGSSHRMPCQVIAARQKWTSRVCVSSARNGCHACQLRRSILIPHIREDVDSFSSHLGFKPRGKYLIVLQIPIRIHTRATCSKSDNAVTTFSTASCEFHETHRTKVLAEPNASPETNSPQWSALTRSPIDDL